jgi:hypothetical protein
MLSKNDSGFLNSADVYCFTRDSLDPVALIAFQARGVAKWPELQWLHRKTPDRHILPAG